MFPHTPTQWQTFSANVLICTLATLFMFYGDPYSAPCGLSDAADRLTLSPYTIITHQKKKKRKIVHEVFYLSCG